MVASLDGWGASYFGYDALSRLVARLTPRPDTVYYAYDEASNLVKLQYPQDFAACYYGYDAAQRLQKLLSPGGNASYYTYDASSNVSLKEMGEIVNSWASFDRADRMVALRYAKPDETTVAYFEYARDVAGRITCMSRETDWAAYYDYDAIDRLTAARWRKNSDSSQIYAFTYEYDAANNRLRHRFEDSAGAEIESGYYSYDAANQLKQRLLQPYDLSTYYGYDANGALLREWDPVAPATTYYEYGANQLVSRVTPPSGSAWNFYYDGQLNRYRIDRGGTDSYMLWDGLNLLEERDGGGNLVARYTQGYSRLPGIGTIVEIYKPGTPDVTYYLCVDHRGTANVLLDEAGDEVGRREYDPFGRIVAESGSWPVDVGWQSNWLMVKIGTKWLCLSKFRIYDPELGIFLSRDFLPYPNKYRAFSNNPMGQVDQDGLAEESESQNPVRVRPTKLWRFLIIKRKTNEFFQDIKDRAKGSSFSAEWEAMIERVRVKVLRGGLRQVEGIGIDPKIDALGLYHPFWNQLIFPEEVHLVSNDTIAHELIHAASDYYFTPAPSEEQEHHITDVFETNLNAAATYLRHWDLSNCTDNRALSNYLDAALPIPSHISKSGGLAEKLDFEFDPREFLQIVKDACKRRVPVSDSDCEEK